MNRSYVAPRTLDAWLQQLDGIVLPIPRDEQVFLQRTLADERLSLRDVAGRIQTSPSFVLAIIREANQGRDEPIASTEMAIRRLGLTRTATLLRSLEALPRPEIAQALRQLQLVSLHALQQADGLFGSRLARLAGDIQLSSLLFLAPLWPLANAHPALFTQWAKRVLIEGEPAQRVEHELFGISLRSLCLALAVHWRLPEWIELGYRLLGRDRRRLVQALHVAHDNLHPLHQQQMLDEMPILRRWLTQPANTVLLANGIAIAAHSGWDDRHNLRWQRLAGLYLNLPLDAVQQAIHQQAVISARLHAQLSLWHPAQMLVSSDAERRAVLPPSKANINTRDALRWQQHCLRLQQPAAFSNAVQLLDCARDALVACGLGRLLLLVANRSHSHLLMQQSHGLTPPPSSISIASNDSPVLRRLLEKPARLVLDADSFPRLSALLPHELTSVFTYPPLMLQSLSGRNRVRLILVAEWPDASQDDVRQSVATTILGIERALNQMIAAAEQP